LFKIYWLKDSTFKFQRAQFVPMVGARLLAQALARTMQGIFRGDGMPLATLLSEGIISIIIIIISMKK
jgi:hypothetical protein